MFLVASMWSLAPGAHAAAPEPLKTNTHAGVSLLVMLGPRVDQARIGFGLNAGGGVIWHQGPGVSDGVEHLAPVGSWGLDAMWIKPHVTTQATLRAGALYPLDVGDAGFFRLLGAEGLAGVAMSTDGSAGVVVGGVITSHLSELRVEATRWDGGWHDPRFVVGVRPLHTRVFYSDGVTR